MNEIIFERWYKWVDKEGEESPEYYIIRTNPMEGSLRVLCFKEDGTWLFNTPLDVALPTIVFESKMVGVENVPPAVINEHTRARNKIMEANL